MPPLLAEFESPQAHPVVLGHRPHLDPSRCATGRSRTHATCPGGRPGCGPLIEPALAVGTTPPSPCLARTLARSQDLSRPAHPLYRGRTDSEADRGRGATTAPDHGHSGNGRPSLILCERSHRCSRRISRRMPECWPGPHKFSTGCIAATLLSHHRGAETERLLVGLAGDSEPAVAVAASAPDRHRRVETRAAHEEVREQPRLRSASPGCPGPGEHRDT